jgi:salicylate hydroxylase
MASIPQDDHVRADASDPTAPPSVNSTVPAHEHPHRPLRLAIVGGGIGGLCLALGLRKHSHIDVQIYEAAHQFSEIGAGIGVGRNAQRALELLGPDVYAAYKKQATEAPFRICNGNAKGELASSVLVPPNSRASQSTVHRAKFLGALVELVPEGWAHFDKRLVSIEGKTAEGGKLILNFKDGTTAEADAIIGADGIHSHTRAYVLDDVPGKEKYQLQYTGAVLYRSIIPMAKVVEALGADITQYSSLFIVDGAMVVSYPVDHHTRLNAAAYTWKHKTWTNKEWMVPVDREEVLESYHELGRPLDPKMMELLNVSVTCPFRRKARLLARLQI